MPAPFTLCHRRSVVLLACSIAVRASAQDTVVKSMTTVRISLPTERRVIGRLAQADSSSIVIRMPDGTAATFARGGVKSLERRADHAKKGAIALGATGAVAGSVFGALLVTSYWFCGNPSGCRGNVPHGMVMFGVVGGGAGAVAGTVLGAMTPRWVPVSNEARIEPRRTDLTCADAPRYELQTLNPIDPGILARGSRLSLAGSCFRGYVTGFELGLIGHPAQNETQVVNDDAFGPVIQTSYKRYRSIFAGGFIELPLGRAWFNPQLVASAGIHSVTDDKSMDWHPTGPPASDFYRKYVPQRQNETARVPGLGLGLRTSAAIGPNFSVGLAARLHQIGTRARLLESGFTFAFRP